MLGTSPNLTKRSPAMSGAGVVETPMMRLFIEYAIPRRSGGIESAMSALNAGL